VEYQYETYHSTHAQNSLQHQSHQQYPRFPTLAPTSFNQEPSSTDQSATETLNQTMDIFQPLLDPDVMDLFPNGELPELSAFDSCALNLDHFDFESET
jgi:hypothetical protein